MNTILTGSECHHAHDKSASDVCTPPDIAQKMSHFLRDQLGMKVPMSNKVSKVESKDRSKKQTESMKSSKGSEQPHAVDVKQVIDTMKKVTKCDVESCIYTYDKFIDFLGKDNVKDILNNYFKPYGPALNDDELSNHNIDQVLDQFEEKFKDRKFLHIPMQTRDFEKVGTQLATVDLAEESKKYDCFGVVLNTDYSYGRGIHWFCLFGDLQSTPISLEYFNSSGKPPLEEVEIWLAKTKHHLEKVLKKPVVIKYSTGIVYQYDKTNCGVWALAYIYARLTRINPEWFRPNNVDDMLMKKIRSELFRLA